MTDKWGRVQDSFDRAHSDLFSSSTYVADFYNYSGGDYDPNSGEITGASRSSFAAENIEIVPPGMDTTVDVDGTELDWDTTIRFPLDTTITGNLVPLGEDSDRPTEVEISDDESSTTTIYELHGYTVEKGSGMVQCRLVEQ